MAEKTPAQVIINPDVDASLQKVYPSTFQQVPPLVGNTSIYISTTTETVYNNYNFNNDPGGNTTEIQFNLNNHMSGDSGLTYNYVTDSLSVAGNLTAGNVKTDNLLYANGNTWSFSSTYSNSNVSSYLPTYTGNITGNRITATLFTGSGAGLTTIPASSLTGTVSNANYSNFTGTVITNAQPNITSVGTLTSLAVTGNISSGNANLGNLTISNYFSGNGSLLTHITGANVTGYVPTATLANTAGTVTTAAQPNITSTGSLTGLTVSSLTGVVNFISTANVSLGAVGNLHITGGTSGQFLSTDGSGTLSWTTSSTPATSNLQQVTTEGNSTDQVISISNTTQSTNYNTGALKVTGGVGVGNNIHALGHISSVTTVYAGLYADFSSYTYPKFVGRDAGSEYIQGALVNTHDGGSSDWVAYGDQSDETQGWSDFGYCGTSFNDPNYTITKSNDGYFFVQGMDGYIGGNMVITTGDKGLDHDIVFGTGGFDANNEMMRLTHSNSTFVIGATVPSGINTVHLEVNGNIISNGNIILNGNIQFPTQTSTRGDTSSGTLTGQTLRFADSSREVIIAGPDGDAGTNFAQRMIIQGGQGYTGTNSEGGDIYLWAGRGSDAGGSGGDLKIRGGYGPLTGDGGYVRLEGGDTAGIGAGGYVDINAGTSTSGRGGDVTINAGQGTIAGNIEITAGFATGVNEGGNVKVTGGYSYSLTGGAVTITGGQSALGLSDYGNVYLESGASQLAFDNTGNLTIPESLLFDSGQQIRPAGSSIIGMYSNVNNYDGVSIYTNTSTDLFNQANVSITAGNNGLSPKIWIYDKLGNITFPDSTVQNTAWTGTIDTGNITGLGNVSTINLDGNASNLLFGNGTFSALPATTASTVDVTNTNGLTTVYYPTFVESRTTGQIVRADVDLSYRTDNNTLSAGNISVSGTIEAGGKIGYSSGSSVTQTTNRGQGVTINSLAGTITLVSDTIAAGDSDVLFVGCNKVDSTSDIVLVQVTSYNPGTYLPIAQPTSTPFAGFQLSLTNISAFASPTEAVTIRFMVIKSPNA